MAQHYDEWLLEREAEKIFGRVACEAQGMQRIHPGGSREVLLSSIARAGRMSLGQAKMMLAKHRLKELAA